MDLLENYQKARKELFDAYRDTRRQLSDEEIKFFTGSEKQKGIEVFIYVSTCTVNHLLESEMYSTFLGVNNHISTDLEKIEEVVFDFLAKEQADPSIH